MRTTGRVASFTVNKKHISVRVEIPTTEGVEELRKYKGKTKTVSLEGFNIHAAIDSLAPGRNLSFLLHAPKKSFIASKLFLLMERQTVDIVVSTDFEDKLLYFLDTVAAKRAVNAADLLYELSSFKREGDRIVPGKRSVFDLSESQGRVIMDKLSGLLQEASRV